MDNPDPASEWRRLSELYRRMSDGELLALAGQNSELTEFAQQALAHEMSQRRLKVEPEKPSALPILEPEPDSLYAEDRKLVEIRTVWSLADALQLQRLLDRAGIPFFMGPERATDVDAVTSNFVNGVSVEIMQIGLAWSRQALERYAPVNEPASEQEQLKQEGEIHEIPVFCPKCNSEEVIFLDLTNEESPTPDDSKAQYEWACDSCGHRWKDDGIINS